MEAWLAGVSARRARWSVRGRTPVVPNSRGCWPRAWALAPRCQTCRATPPTVLADALGSTAPCTWCQNCKVTRLQAAQAVTQRAKRPPACSGLRSGPERRKLGSAGGGNKDVQERLRQRLVPYPSRRFCDQSGACRSRPLKPLLASNHCGGACSVAPKAPEKTSKPAASTSARVASLICRTRCGSEA